MINKYNCNSNKSIISVCKIFYKKLGLCLSVYRSDILTKLKKKAKIRNRYNQVPHLTHDTILERDTNTRKHIITRETRGQPFPSR